MVDLKEGFDSAVIQRCDWCHNPIEPEDAKVLYGTGSLLVAYHVRCEKNRRKELDDARRTTNTISTT